MEMGRGYQEDGAMYSNSSESMYHTPSLASIYQVKSNVHSNIKIIVTWSI